MEYSGEQLLVSEWEGEGNLLVNALAGTGKTESVAYRVSCLLERGYKPDEVLVISFSNASVDSIRDRLESYLIEGVKVSTFDSLSVSVAAPRLGLEVTDGWAEAVKLLNDYKMDVNSAMVRRFLTLSNRVKSVDSVVDGFYGVSEPVFYKMLEDYALVKREAGVADFDDFSGLASRLNQRRYREVIVDEAQDCSPSHLLFLESLVSGGGRIVFVGDRYQSVYGFNGADPLLFERYCSGWSELALTGSYRSSSVVLEEVNKVFGTGLSSKLSGGSVERVSGVRELVERASGSGGSVALLARSGSGVGRLEGLVRGGEVTVSTVHKVKGREFDSVGILNLEEMLEGDGEEQRLAYVALSRARSSLILG